MDTNEKLCTLYCDSEICCYIFQNLNNNEVCLTDYQWRQLGECLDNIYNQFSIRLFILCPKVSEIELHVCYLLKLSVPLSAIAHFTAHQRNSISSLRERLYKKIHKKEGSGKMLDQFIANF